MNEKLRVLILEDRPADAELMLREVRKEGIEFTPLRVETERDFRKQLQEFRPGLILADFSLPTYDGMSALAAAQEECPDVPFIFVSDNLGEETAVEGLHHGATDYILKQRLSRLGAAVRRALLEVKERNELKRAERGLRDSEMRYRRLFESAKDGILILDAETGMVVDVNPFLVDLLGFSREAFLGKKVWELGFFRDIVANQANFAELQQKEYVRYDDMALETSDGRRIEVEFVSNVYLVNGHKVIQCNIRDITEHKHAAEESRMVLRTAMDGFWVVDSQGRLLEANEAYCRLIGYTRDELLAMSISDIEAAEAPEETAAHIAAIMRAGSGRFITRHRRKDGAVLDVEASVNYLPRNGGRIFVFIRDITERKQAEGALRLQSAALNAAANPMVITDRGGTISWVNAAFTVATGYGAEEALGKNPRELVKSGVHDQMFYKKVWDTILAGNVWHGEMTNRRKDGSLYPEQQTITPVKDAGGEITHFIAVKQDLTAQKRLEAQFHQAQKMEAVGRLAGGVAHDFNNLLTVIIGEADLALGEIPSGGAVAGSLAEIRKAGERAAALTRQLLMFSRHKIVEQTVFGLNELVADMDKMLGRLIGEDVIFEMRLAPDVGVIRADRGQMEQVFANLVINARDAMPKGGHLILETAALESKDPRVEATGILPPGRYVVASVTDTGIGMGADTRSHIFEPFFTTKGPGKGTGLGLSTVYGIVQRAGGQIGLYSEVGVGTTFRIYLPVVEAPVDATTRGPVSGWGRRGNETVLLVEDDSGVRRLTRALLERLGYRVLEAADPAEALGLSDAFKEHIHLLITDVVMPGMGGQDLVARLVPLRPKMKILFTSGYTERAVVVATGGGGAPNFIQKPFTPDELALKVRRVLDE